MSVAIGIDRRLPITGVVLLVVIICRLLSVIDFLLTIGVVDTLAEGHTKTPREDILRRRNARLLSGSRSTNSTDIGSSILDLVCQHVCHGRRDDALVRLSEDQY